VTGANGLPAPTFVRRRGGLLVPVDTLDTVATAQPAADIAALRRELAAVRDLAVTQQAEHHTATTTVTEPASHVDDVDEAARLRAQLAAARDLVAVQAEDAWVRRAQATEHRIAMADVDERAAAAQRARRERASDAVEADALAALYRRATRSGARARIRAEIQGSAEMRALRCAAVRRVALLAGLPVLAAFASWSTTGVQAGVVRLLGLTGGSASWWASWAVEPALITVVALIIVGRAVLRSAGGDTDWRAGLAEWTALGMSLALNILGGWSGLGGALPHAIGPLGCAGTAALVGLFDGYVTAARPWDGAPRLADMDLTAPVAVPAPAAVAVPAQPVIGDTREPTQPALPAPSEPAGRPIGEPVREPAGEPAQRYRREPGDSTEGPVRQPLTRPGHASVQPLRGESTQQRRTAAAARRTNRLTVSARTDSATGQDAALAAAYGELTAALGREPSGAELAAQSGVVSKATANRWKANRAGSAAHNAGNQTEGDQQ
jgi:hypothetical protein